MWHSSIDQMGAQVVLSMPPARIISLVPSQTELLYDLGLESAVVGITKFCVHPGPWLKSKTIIGGTKSFHLDVIRSLHPDLIIGNKEENYVEGIEALKKDFTVWMSDITTYDDAIGMISSLSEITNAGAAGKEVIQKIQRAFSDIPVLPPLRTLYFMWRKPWMGAAGGTFIHTMISKLGLVNVLAHEVRYPELTQEAIAALSPELVMLSTEPFPFSDKHIREVSEIVPQARIVVVDGEMFSWYGSRLALAPAYFKSLHLGR